MAFLILLKNSKENENSLEDETDETEEQFTQGQKSKRCKALNLLGKSRLIAMPKYAQKSLSGSAEGSISNSVQHMNDGISYFRLASRKDTNNILKSLLKSRSTKHEDSDSTVSISQKNQDPIVLLGQDLKRSGNQRAKKYVCFCIEDNCEMKKPMKTSRPYAISKTFAPIIGSSYFTNEENQRISGLTSPEEQNLGAPSNLHCPPGAVLVEESDYSEYSDRRHHSHKRRPVKKCPPIIMPWDSEAQSIGQPMRVNIPLAGNRNFNRCVYKVDRTLPFVQKLQSLIEQNNAHGEVKCQAEKGSSYNSGLGVQDYHYNNQQGVNHYEEVPITRNLVHPSSVDFFPQYSQYPQYSDSFVGDSRIPLKPVDQPYNGHHESSFKAAALGRHFLDTEECAKAFGSKVCTASTTPFTSGKNLKATESYEEEQEDSTTSSQSEEEIRHTTPLPSRKINKWEYPTNVKDNDKLAKTYFHVMGPNKADKKPGEYFSSQRMNTKKQQSYNVPEITASNNKIVSSTDKKQTNFDDQGNDLEQNSPIRYSGPKYPTSIANSDQSGTEDYYDVTEKAREGGLGKIPSVGIASKFPQPASTSISSTWQKAQSASSPQYLQYTIKPTEQDINPSLGEHTSKVVAGYVSTPHDSEASRYAKSEDQNSENIFHPEQDRNEDEPPKYYTTSERVGVTLQHSIYGSLSDDENRKKSSTESPNTVFMKMEEPWINHRTTISTKNLEGNSFQGSQRITTVYPVIDDDSLPASTLPTTQSSNNGNDENTVFPSSNLYYSIQPERNAASVAATIATNMAAPRRPVGTTQSTPINNYSKSDSVASSINRGNNHHPTSHMSMKSSVHNTTPLLGINKAEQRKFTVASYPTSTNFEAKTVSSRPEDIKQTNSEDNNEETTSTPYYTARLEKEDIDQYSTIQKSSKPQFVGSHRLKEDARTTKNFYSQFPGSHQPTTENVISTKKYTDYRSKPVGRPRDEYTTSYVQNLPAENTESSNEHPFDTYLSKKVTNHYSRVPSRNWEYTTESGKKITSFVDEKASTPDYGGQKQFVGSHQLFADTITPSSRSDVLNRPTSRLEIMHLPTATSGLQKNSQQLSEIPSESLYSSQFDKPLYTTNHRTSTQPDDLEWRSLPADNNYSTEDITNIYTPSESILNESTTETEIRKSEKNRDGQSRHPSKESHQIITTLRKYENDREENKPFVNSLHPSKMSSSFENNSDINKEFKGAFSSNSVDDKFEEVTEPDSDREEMEPKYLKDFFSTSSDGSAATDNNETEDINSSPVAHEEVGATNQPTATDTVSISNSKLYATNHNVAVEDSSQTSSTSKDKVIIGTQIYKEDDDFSPLIQIINEDEPQLYPDMNYEEKYMTTSYQTVSPQSIDDIIKIQTKKEFENPPDAMYSSPMSAAHSFRNPLKTSDILKSENVVHDKYLAEDHGHNYSRTNQYSQTTPKIRIQNRVKGDDQSDAVFERHKLTLQGNIVSNPQPATGTFENHSSTVSGKKEKLTTSSDKLSGRTHDTQGTVPHDTVGDTASKEKLNTKKTEQKYCTEPLAKSEPKFNTDREGNILQDESLSNNVKIPQPSYLDTAFYKLKKNPPTADMTKDAVSAAEKMVNKAEAATALTTEKISQQNGISKKDSSLGKIMSSYDRIEDVQKGIINFRPTPMAKRPETNDENTIGRIAAKNELHVDKNICTNDCSSLENSRETDYSPYPYDQSSSSPAAEETPSIRPFEGSQDLTSTSKQVLSSTSKNKESVGVSLSSDSAATAGNTNLLTSFAGAKSASTDQKKKCNGLNSTNKVVLQPPDTIYQTTSANEYTEDIVSDDGTSDEDRSHLKNAVQRVVNNLVTLHSRNACKNAPNTPDTVATSNHELSSGSPVLKNIFSLPEVKDMVINSVKELISEDSDAPQAVSSDQLKDHEIESVLNGVVNNLLLGKGTSLSSSMPADQYENSHWTGISASVPSIGGTVMQKTVDEISNIIQRIIERPAIGLRGARLPVIQNIIVRAVENALTKTKEVVDHSLILNTLNNIIARAENAAGYSYENGSTLEPLPNRPDQKKPSSSKNMPIIPVIEHVFKDGKWSEKETVLGMKKSVSDSKLSSSTTLTSSDDNGFPTSSSSFKTSMINTNNLEVTTDAADYALLGESEEEEDDTTDRDVVEVTAHVPVENVIENVGARSSKQNVNDEGDPENAPIKYYSPNDRILTYIKNHQTLEGKTHTNIHSSDINEGTKYCPPSDTRSNHYSTMQSLVESEDATTSESNEDPVDQRLFTPQLVEPAEIEESVESEETGEQTTSEEQTTTQTLRYKFTKMPKYYDSPEEATTSALNLVGAAKSRGKNQHLRNNKKASSNFEASQSDPTYFGKLSLNGEDPTGGRISDLANKDLFYIGDGVRIPLTIRRMPDGSYALSISEKICEKFVNRKCPCCVPNEGDIVEETRQLNVADEVDIGSTSERNSYDLASFETTESSEYESQSRKRYVRSTSGGDIITTNISPVRRFVKKYNMTLNLEPANILQRFSATNEKNIEHVGNTRRSKRLGSFGDTKITNLFENNQIQRDDSKEPTGIVDDNPEVPSKGSNSIRYELSDDKETNSLIHNLLHIRDVPEDKRTEIVVNALDGLINAASARNLSPIGHQGTIEFIDEDSAEDQSQWEGLEDSSVYDLQDVNIKNAGYGYQKDNPILERIKFTKEDQPGRGQYKYQQNMDHHARGKMKVLKTVLRWLRKVFLEAKVNDKN